MSDELSKSLNMRPLQDALHDKAEMFEDEASLPVPVQEEEVRDPYFDQADHDAQMVRNNILQLLQDGADLFGDVKYVAMNTQDPEQYGAAARMFSELIKANKELMNVHKDIFTMRPAPVEQPKQQANTINNMIITGNAMDIMEMLAKQGIKPARAGDPDAIDYSDDGNK